MLMKNLLLILLSFISFVSASGGAIVEEGYLVNGDIREYKELFAAHPELVIDHANKNEFEIYGPNGLGQWLTDLSISYIDLAIVDGSMAKNFDDYPSYTELDAFLKKTVALYPTIAKLISIGKSVEGRDLWMVKISDNVAVDELEPEFKYISSMHGDEIVGRELTQFFIADLLSSYNKDPKITDLINQTEIYIMPSLNPDGSERRQRGNARNVDLNRNFPDWTRNQENTTLGRQPETKAIMKFQDKRNFALSANFHGGAICVNYPWDSSYERHPQDHFLQYISKEYSFLNPEMKNSRYFEDGITNGADWYVLKGGMQDWSYIWYNDLQVTVELSNTKWPRYSKISDFYQSNKDSMLRYLGLVHSGAGFSFQDKNITGTVRILNSDNSSLGEFNFRRGEFYKVLPEGIYTFKVKTLNKEFTFERTVDEKISDYKILSL